jgi:hypothetical protein
MFATTKRSTDLRPALRAISFALILAALLTAGAVIAMPKSPAQVTAPAAGVDAGPATQARDDWFAPAAAPAPQARDDWFAPATGPATQARDDWFVTAPAVPAGGATSPDRGYGRHTGSVLAPSFTAGAGNTQERGLGHR